MGCNTSKETLPQEENKEKQDDGTEKTEERKQIKLTDSAAQISENHVEDRADSKPASAKTITLHSGSPAAVASSDQNKSDSKQSSAIPVDKEHKANNKEDPEKEDPEEVERAATKIQAAFRGHTTRKTMKQPAGKVEPSTAASQEPTREELEAEFRLDDEELCHAATKIQASFRGHMTRKLQDEEKKNEESSTSKTKEAELEDKGRLLTTVENYKEEELDIDLTDPELNKAAVKIQASFRGHMTRKDEHPNENK